VALKDSSQEGKNPILVPRIKLSNGEIYKAAGYVDFVNNEVDSSTGTIAVWAVFDNRDGMLLPGQYVTVLLKQSKPEILPVVLQSAVQEDRQGRYVLIVNAEDRVVERRVKTGPFVGIWWAIESGLTEGEKVIVQGVQKVRPGQLVKTITENEQKER
jgi:membrane fusion protein (multidrug efflux system)